MVKEERTEYGKVIYHYEDEYRYALYIYDDDRETVYLSNIKVNDNVRKCGIGNRILSLAENEAAELGAEKIILKVIDGSWMMEWYKRHGYVELVASDVPEDKQPYMWLVKRLG